MEWFVLVRRWIYNQRDFGLGLLLGAAIFFIVPEVLLLLASGLQDEPFVRRLLGRREKGWESSW